MIDAVALLRSWIDIPSPTGHEALFAERVVADLRALGVPARLSEAAPGRPNVVGGADPAEVVLCTHIDVVDPHIPSSEDETHVYGRGACDAKGCMMAQLLAWLSLEEHERARVGLLFVAGEERDHVGARAARSGPAPRTVILGEPCGLVVARAQKGMLKVRITAVGRAAHSAYPECGVSATHRLLDALERLRRAPMPASAELGETTFHVAQLAGGVAANVIAPSAEAIVMFRQTVPARELLARVAELVAGEGVSVFVLGESDPVLYEVPEGTPQTCVVPFNTDATTLSGWSERFLLAGPGDMVTAHGPGERIAKAALSEGARQYLDLVRHELVVRPA